MKGNLILGNVGNAKLKIYTDTGTIDYAGITLISNTRPLVIQEDGGKVGIGTISPSYTLDVVGTIHSSSDILADGQVTATNFIIGSDRRLKDNIEDINNISFLDRIVAKQFTLKSDKIKRLN